jgi:hypothetical protein
VKRYGSVRFDAFSDFIFESRQNQDSRVLCMLEPSVLQFRIHDDAGVPTSLPVSFNARFDNEALEA